jgi:hypothetical protein
MTAQKFDRLKPYNDLPLLPPARDIENDPEDSFSGEEWTTDISVDYDITFPNSILLSGGFIIKEKFRKKGIGEKTIKLIFDDNPDIDNILLYTIEWQGAVDFWYNIGGEQVLYNDKNGLHFIKLSRDTYDEN